jgi:hypothetical protein
MSHEPPHEAERRRAEDRFRYESDSTGWASAARGCGSGCVVPVLVLLGLIGFMLSIIFSHL